MVVVVVVVVVVIVVIVVVVCGAVQLDLQPSAITVDPFYAPLGLSSLQCTQCAASDKDRVQLR